MGQRNLVDHQYLLQNRYTFLLKYGKIIIENKKGFELVMCEYFGRKGNNVYLCDMSSRICWVFDDFGSFVSDTGTLIDCTIHFEVETVSILGVNSIGGSECEVYFKGNKVALPRNLFDVMGILRVSKEKKYVGQFLMRRYELEGEGLTQVFFPYKVGTMSLRELSGMLGVCVDMWERC